MQHLLGVLLQNAAYDGATDPVQLGQQADAAAALAIPDAGMRMHGRSLMGVA